MKQTLKHSIEIHNFIFRERSSAVDTKIIHLNTEGGKRVYKFSYENGNSFEHFKGEIFNGDEMKMVFNLTDLGVSRNTSAYLMFNEIEIKDRISMLTRKGLDFIKKLY